MKRLILITIFFLLAGIIVAQDAPETAVQYIEIAGLTGADNDEDAEISGLGWYEDWLVIMPQNPIVYRRNLFAVHRDDLLTYINGDDSQPLEPVQIQITNRNILGLVPGYNGFEGLVFYEDRVFMTLEAFSTTHEMTGFLIAGTIEESDEGLAITLDEDSVIELPPPPEDYFNFAQEAITIINEKIITFYEANGQNAVAEPFAYVIDMNDFDKVETIPMAYLEYRLTDATLPDEEGVFWVSNFFFPGDSEKFLLADTDPLFEQYGISPSNERYGAFERLVALQYNEDEIQLADIAPIQLDVPLETGRNWEGIVRLDDVGFFIATDKYPETLLGFVPLGNE